MTLFQHTGGDPRVASAQLADVLAWYGAVGDAAFGNAPHFAMRKASIAVALAQTGGNLLAADRDAVYFAGLLHACGTITNAAYRKGVELDERTARTHRWDIPAHGARLCETIDTLPPATADLVRWQAECWDGTGFPDQLRWHGIPKHAQHLALADAFLKNGDPEEALAAIALESGRAFGPENVRTFVLWFHTVRGDGAPHSLPFEPLDPAKTQPAELLERFADKIDEHNAVPGRWRRVERIALGAAPDAGLDERSTRALMLAARLFGSGEIAAPAAEHSQFDPLSRLGIESRAQHAARSAALIEERAALREAAHILAARAEWFDGTGKPNGVRASQIPAAAGVLAAAIAYCGLDHGERLDTAAGTQFDPRIVRAVLDAAKAHA